ncbi:MAG: PRD domain-containing protein [Thomasclavelia sp.]|jgi:beta-glucoside operon transcriptional antiterminator|nr:PRD domain-containing protein [Thomasclavelia sp.]
MKIVRILNNNAVMSVNEYGKEIVVKGKGIAFKKSIGDNIDLSKIDKTFISDDTETQRRYQELMISIPYDCVTVCEKIIDVIKEKLNHELSDKIYVTLTDHVFNLLERMKMGITFDNALLWDVKRLYTEEYEAGSIAVDMIREAFNVKVENDEASFIALHIVNAEINTNFEELIHITSMIDDIYEIVESTFNLDIDKEGLVYTRFIMHLRVFFERIIHNNQVKNEKSETLLNNLKKSYPKQYDCAMNIIKYVSMRYDEPLDGEILYLLVHIIKLTE